MKKVCSIKKIEQIAKRFLKKPPHNSWRDLQKCRVAFDRCYDVSNSFQRYLNRHGCSSEVIHLDGFLGKIPKRGHPAYRGQTFTDGTERLKPLARRDMNHGIVKVGDFAIDMTGAQFKPAWAGLRIVHMKQVSREWKHIQTYDEKWEK